MSAWRALRRWWLERQARREVDALRDRVLGHWAAIGHGGEWTAERDQFFLTGAREKRGLPVEPLPKGLPR